MKYVCADCGAPVGECYHMWDDDYTVITVDEYGQSRRDIRRTCAIGYALALVAVAVITWLVAK